MHTCRCGQFGGESLEEFCRCTYLPTVGQIDGFIDGRNDSRIIIRNGLAHKSLGIPN